MVLACMLQEVQKQRVQAYAAELEAQIRAKQDHRRAERKASLIQSQDLLAARHAAPLAALPVSPAFSTENKDRYASRKQKTHLLHYMRSMRAVQ